LSRKPPNSRGIDGRNRQHRDAGAAGGRRGPQFGVHLFGAQRIVALDQLAKILERGPERAHQLAAEPGDADALDAVVGLHLHREEFTQHAGHVGRTDQRLFQRQTNEIDFCLSNFHVVPRFTTCSLSRMAGSSTGKG
jgi:hypothetical protein